MPGTLGMVDNTTLSLAKSPAPLMLNYSLGSQASSLLSERKESLSLLYLDP